MNSVEDFNSASEDEALTKLLTCCGSSHWACEMLGHRPFAGADSLFATAETIWFALDEAAWLAAFAAHPRIGERKAATTDYLAHSTTEQAEAQQTLEPVAEALLLGNRAYEEKFGFRYIVFASGRSAPELLDILESRLNNTRDEELQEAARQQHLITRLRMTKWLET